MNIRSKIDTLCYLLKTWGTAMPRILYRSTISLLFDPKGAQHFINQVLNAQDIQSGDSVLDSVGITDLLKDNQIDVHIIGSFYKSSTSEVRLLKELASLVYIMQVLKPRLIFEMGTFIGRTSRLLALNSPPDCKILTIDLPQDKVSHQIGEEFLQSPEGHKITQLYGDTRNFDFSPWYGQCDFVWVDACHDYEYVMSDTENALRLCRPNGWIAWHDYHHTAWWSGVTKCVRRTHRAYPNLVHLCGTTIAVLPGKDGNTSRKPGA